YQDVAVVSALFFGLKAAVLSVVLEALVRIGKRVLKNRLMFALAALSFLAIFFAHAPFPLIVLGAGAFGFVASRAWPASFPVVTKKASASGDARPVDLALERDDARVRPSLARTLRTLAAWLAIWFAPLGVLALALGVASVFVQAGLFF